LSRSCLSLPRRLENGAGISFIQSVGQRDTGMIFIGIAILIVAGLVLLISADAGSLVGLSQMQTAQIIPLLVLLIIFAGGMFTRRHKASELLWGVVLWGGLFSVAMVSYAYRDELMGVVSRVAGEFQPNVALIDS